MPCRGSEYDEAMMLVKLSARLADVGARLDRHAEAQAVAASLLRRARTLRAGEEV